MRFFFNDAETSRTRLQTLRKEAGNHELGSWEKNKRVEFETKGVELTKTQLKGGWIYMDGSRPRTADTLAGLWIKVFEDDKLLAEYSNPPTLRREQKFE